MRLISAMFALAVASSVYPGTFYRGEVSVPTTTEQSQMCVLATQVLESVAKLKPGVRRSDVEKDFELDGGLSTPERATYVHRRCHHIKVNVEFRLAEGRHDRWEFSADDKVSGISTPYLAYPVSD